MRRHSALRRVLLSAAALGLGAVVGTFAGLYHSAVFPWGLSVVLVLVLLAVLGIGTLNAARYPVVWMSVGLMGSLVLLAGVDGNGSVLILADTPGWSLLGGATLIVVGGIAWPRFHPRDTGYDRGVASPERISQP